MIGFRLVIHLFHLDIFLAALKLLKHPSPNRVVVIGDTPWDAQGESRTSSNCTSKRRFVVALAAVAAKLPIVGVLCGGFEEGLLRKSGCAWIYRDIIELTKNYDQVTRDILKSWLRVENEKNRWDIIFRPPSCSIAHRWFVSILDWSANCSSSSVYGWPLIMVESKLAACCPRSSRWFFPPDDH